ncbi:MAG: hypothetical protein V4542_00905 [Pseudomonadota bacterium]
MAALKSSRARAAVDQLPAILQNLAEKPKASDAYLWCDYIELRCLTSIDHRFSRGNLSEMFAEIGAVMDAHIDNEDDEDEDEEIIEGLKIEANAGNAVAQAVVAFDTPDGSPTGVIPPADIREGRAGSIFASLAHRASVFGEYYPFELNVATQELSMRDANTATRALYLQLLLSSSLRLVPKKRRHELTEPFELVAEAIFKCLMPGGWQVHRFGAKGAASQFKGKLFNRLTTLASDIRATLAVKARHFNDHNVGDGGLDLVAWHPLGNDSRSGIPIAFAQCGCAAEEWSLKTLDCSPSKIGPYFHGVTHPWATYYFMPQDLYEESPDGPDWQQRLKLTSSIVLDRLRLIRLADEYCVADTCFGTESQVYEAFSSGAMVSLEAA